MLMSAIVTAMVAISVICGLYTGRGGEVATAALDGAEGAVTLCISMFGVVCLWTGVMEVMKKSGLASALAGLLRPLLSRLYPRAACDTLESISANFSANLLGLGNAATPLGLEAAKQLSGDGNGVASDGLCMLVVCNTASIQLIPTTVAALRSGLGSGSPFDILPAVWLASSISIVVGISTCRLFAHIWRD